MKADTRKPMVWPWPEHEGCQAYLVRLRGEVCGRICKRCNVIETHLLVDPIEGRVSEQLDIDSIPVGST